MTKEIEDLLRSLDILDGKTLDVGSLDVNGSVRGLFMDYVGVDIQEGPNVDFVIKDHTLPFTDGEFDLVICLNTLEHDDKFWLTVDEMKRVLRPGGTLFIEVPNYQYRTIHNHPADYYRFSDEALKKMLDGFDDVTNGLIPGRTDLSYIHGVKA